ncbi:hypothetical protein SPRG_07865 [Saprolegnia parasitica CBS 223.65]|uniref:Uncharacterized protein n=1 Tax=Saprolegnia parasitica (strain CBS 223.65) TaxID=695850 RepID=A0A067C9I9_SAPPC|nr:hypothetical protein SPRG_07865 [Saprolegnia parasitica CBS 223.65]KDO27158.1 hypothetical protein SPRG_07865 [Saprolegnia parasitica CBS 223.65]|eukprot:XP_012202246.1 hypothetical protein SPRG_07865 [Saprolegnia parasitica CBS 223.65]
MPLGISPRQRLEALLGVTYMVLSVLGGLAYLCVLAQSSSNALWWPNYNASGYEAFLIDLVNQILPVDPSGSWDLRRPDAMVRKTYDASVGAMTRIYPPYIHSLLVSSRLTSPAFVIPKLRALTPFWSMRINVPTCWVDFNQTFEMALTIARQLRCARRYRHNAAVYLEAVGRNQVWSDYMAMWGTPGSYFDVAVQQGLSASAAGRTWLADVSIASRTTTIADEVAYWQSHHLTTFELQWQNRWLTSISETLTLTNVFGFHEALPLKVHPLVAGSWSSQTMNWMPIQVAFNAMILNRSMVRGTARYFGINATELPAINFETYRGLADAHGQLVGQAALFHATIGPYFNVDTRVFPMVPELSSAYNTFYTALFERLDASKELLKAFQAVSPLQLAPLPASWRNATHYFGGNPMCTHGAPTAFVQAPFSFFDDCNHLRPFTVHFQPVTLLFALLAANATLPEICALQTNVEPLACSDALAASISVLADLALPASVLAAIDRARPALDAAQISLMQFAQRRSANASWALLTAPLVSHAMSRGWLFYGWGLLLEWATGSREVVSFEGNHATLVLISDAYTGEPFVMSNNKPLDDATRVLYYLVVYSAGMLAIIGLYSALYAIRLRFHLLGRNLFFFNRIAGSIWVGWPTLVLRGLSAILMLSTSQLSLVQVGDYRRLVFAPRPLWQTLLVAGEATWVLYVVTDILLVSLPHQETVRVYGPLGSLGAFIVLVGFEMSSPIQATLSLQRDCTMQNLDYAISCTAGALLVGDKARLGTLVGAQLVVLFIAMAATYALRRRTHRATALKDVSLLLSGLPAALLTPAHAQTDKYDAVSCVLCGIVPFTWRKRREVFHLISWGVLQDTIARSHCNLSRVSAIGLSSRAAMASPCMHRLGPRLPRRLGLLERGKYVKVALGGCFMVVAITSSISYLQVAKANLANDFFWATFEMTTTHSFFGSWLNEQLVLRVADSALDATHGRLNLLGTNIATVSATTTYGATLAYGELSMIEASIAGLRVSDACNAPWIFTPYCYLDWKKTWPMAYSHQRQMRCQKMESNAAVYLESVLRNIDWATFEFCWGNAFETAFGVDLRQTSQGEAWLLSVSTERLPLQAEAALWRQHNLSVFQVQWQNYKRIGVFNSYSIVNAFGISYPMQLMALNGSYRWSSQTTYKMYWSLANDLSAIVSNTSGIGGLSLMRTSPRFAFANTSLQAVLTTNLTLMSPLANGLALVAESIGPFGVIDLVYVSVPSLVVELVRDILNDAREAMAANVDAQNLYASIVPNTMSCPIPAAWSALETHGSSPLCPEYLVSKPLAKCFSNLVAFSSPCLPAVPSPSRITATRTHYLVSAILASVTHATNLSAVCAADASFVPECRVLLNTTRAFLTRYLAPATYVHRTHLVNILVDDLNISFMVYTPTLATSLQLLSTPIFDAPSFRFFGWTYLTSWVLGLREVIAFQGDHGTLTLLADEDPELTQDVLDWQLATNAAQYWQSGVMYVTCVMLAVTVIVSLYVFALRGHIEGLNMLELSRVGGIVWLETSGVLSRFTAPPTPWYTVLLAAGETTWLVAVVNDLELIFTREHAALFVTPNSILVWLLVAVLTSLQPITASLTIQRECHVTEMDYQVHCHSAEIAIGSVHRLLQLHAIVLGCTCVSYLVVRIRSVPSCPTNSLLLSSGAKYLFLHGGRILDDVYYIDRASAALTGILTLRYGTSVYALDIKLWRLVVTPIHDRVVHGWSGSEAELAATYALID